MSSTETILSTSRHKEDLGCACWGHFCDTIIMSPEGTLVWSLSFMMEVKMVLHFLFWVNCRKLLPLLWLHFHGLGIYLHFTDPLKVHEIAYWEAYSAVALTVKTFLVRISLNLQYVYVEQPLSIYNFSRLQYVKITASEIY